MPNTTTRYVTWVSRGRRHHGSALLDIGNPTHSQLTTGDTYQPSWAPPALNWTDNTQHQHTGTFAFMSITGGVQGGQVVFDSNTPPTITVGTTDINVLVVYIEGGSGGGTPGAYIDAFDVNIGNFVDDDFVEIVNNSALNATANNDGFLPSTRAYDIKCFSAIHTVPFSEWRVITGVETINGRDLMIAGDRKTSVSFAFYQTPVGTTSVPKPGRLNPVESESTWVSWGVKVDGGGPTGDGPVDPWNPLLRELAAGFALVDAAKKVNLKLRGELLDLASKQIAMSAESLQKEIKTSKKVLEKNMLQLSDKTIVN